MSTDRDLRASEFGLTTFLERDMKPMLAITLSLFASLIGLSLSDESAAAPEAPPAVGEQARDFTLNGLDGKAARLKALTQKSPVVLVVLRGFPGYQCPICSRQVGEFLGRAPDLQKAGAQVVLVYPGPADQLKVHAQEFLASRKLPENFTLVLDPDYRFTNAYGLRWEAPRETAYPSTFVIDRKGKVRYSLVSKNHGGRASAADVLTALAQLH